MMYVYHMELLFVTECNNIIYHIGERNNKQWNNENIKKQYMKQNEILLQPG